MRMWTSPHFGKNCTSDCGPLIFAIVARLLLKLVPQGFSSSLKVEAHAAIVDSVAPERMIVDEVVR